MASKAAYKRLAKEYMLIQASPPEYIIAKPSEANILDWYYIITGPPATPYEGGQYFGVLNFPSDYPFKPPSIKLITPNGRFKTDFRLCLSMSDYHPDTWNPAWSVATILTGLLSFMVTEDATTGSIVSADVQKKMFASQSRSWNLANSRFRENFPEVCTQTEESLSAETSANSSLHVRNRAGVNKTEVDANGVPGTAILQQQGVNREGNSLKSFVMKYWGAMMLIGLFGYLFLMKIVERLPSAGQSFS